jgi:YggT family protein
MELLALIGLFSIKVFRYVLWARIILDLVRALNPRFKPRGIFLVLADLAYILTNWAIKPLSRLIKPIRVGAGYMDFSVLLLFFVLFGLEWLLSTLR